LLKLRYCRWDLKTENAVLLVLLKRTNPLLILHDYAPDLSCSFPIFGLPSGVGNVFRPSNPNYELGHPEAICELEVGEFLVIPWLS
jgi:hypothetical protein